MKLITKFIALNLALIATFSAGAADNGGDPMVNQRLVQLLERLESAASETYMAVPLAAISASGTFKFTITVNRVSANTEPMACQGNVSHYTPSGLSYYESASGRVVWSGNTGTCTITLPYLWIKADTLTKVSISTSLSPYYPCTSTCVERPIQRYSSHYLGQRPLPANNALTNITDSFRI